jgi:hypothetical protein
LQALIDKIARYRKIAFQGRPADEPNNNDLIKKLYLGL